MGTRETSKFSPAERHKAKLRLGICGPSGSGKTYSALLIASGLAIGENEKIALIDTERGSGELYAGLCRYDVATITPPFSPERYIETIHAAESEGYAGIIIDSLTHAWAGEGGLLDMHALIAKSSRSKNSYVAWREVTPHHNALVDSMIQSPAHIIATMRTKTEYAEQETRGKKSYVKVGMAPIQRDGMDYEFTTVFDLSIDHIASVSKDRTSLFDSKPHMPTAETGKRLREWLDAGIDAPPASEKAEGASLTVPAESPGAIAAAGHAFDACDTLDSVETAAAAIKPKLAGRSQAYRDAVAKSYIARKSALASQAKAGLAKAKQDEASEDDLPW